MHGFVPLTFCFRIKGGQWATVKSSEVLYRPPRSSEFGSVSRDRLREGSSLLLRHFRIENFCMLF